MYSRHFTIGCRRSIIRVAITYIDLLKMYYIGALSASTADADFIIKTINVNYN
jgi:hypothetical protein